MKICRQRHSTVQSAKLHDGPETPDNTWKAVLNAVTSFPAPGRKLFTAMVRPGAGKGASITLRINGCTRAGDISRLFSTSSKICKKINQTVSMPACKPAEIQAYVRVCHSTATPEGSNTLTASFPLAYDSHVSFSQMFEQSNSNRYLQS